MAVVLSGASNDRPARRLQMVFDNAFGLVPGLGSTLIKRGDTILGAVGVSGGKPEQDLDCCTAALTAV